jgi:endonuclease YncB( thermonuclease family)
MFKRLFWKLFFKYYNVNNVKLFTFNGKKLYAKVCDVYDGDTFKIVFRHHFKMVKLKCRAFGYDSPEMKPLKSLPNREEEIKLAKEAKEYFINLCNKHNNLVFVNALEFDKYGRLLVKVYSPDKKEYYNQMMIDNTSSKEYFGGKKERIVS